MKEVRIELDWIRGVRRTLHEMAELSFEEYETSDWLEKQIVELGFKPLRMAGTGLVVDLPGLDETAPKVLLRADIDALPIQEKTGLPFASRNKGKMHACGHDGHASMVLAVLKHAVVNSWKPLRGIRFIFQPAEEQGGGAEVMVREGVLQGVGECYGLHLCNRLPSGRVGVDCGPFSAFIDEFELKIEGRGGHAARPYLCTEPMGIALRLIQDCQWMMARELNAMHPNVLSFSYIQSGSRFNVIPDECLLGGTLRSMYESDREYVLSRLRKKLDLLREEYSCKIDFELHTGYPAIENSELCTTVLRQCVEEELGSGALCREIMGMGGEDFAYFSREVPSCYFLLGSGGSGKDFAPHHNPAFNFDEDVLELGYRIFVRALLKRAFTSPEGV